jgi:sterol 3beta-glucosyltransferase
LPAPIVHRLNRIRWDRERRLLRRLSAPLINPHRVDLGLAPLDEPLQMDSNSYQLALFAVSRHVACPPPDWPPRYHLTGYFFPEHAEWQPDPALAAFLDRGDRPIVITFGSMVHRDPGAMAALVLAAIERVGCRAILQRGWSGLLPERLPPSVHLTDYVPFGWLFPRVACVVQHGGAGTMAETLRAGVPAVFVPHLNVDQPLWASLARSLGCAGPAVPYHQITAKRLASAIAATLADERLKQSAAHLGQLIRSEGGVRTARERIEALVGGGTRLARS